MTNELPPVRRIVTANRQDGRSYFAEDRDAPAVHTQAGRPGFRLTNLWVTEGAPVPIDAVDGSEAHRGLMPPKNGTVVRIIDMPPEPSDPEERRKQFMSTFTRLYSDTAHEGSGARHTAQGNIHPGMHTTETIDYAIILAGEIYAIMDEGEKLMKAGDVLIQRGTNHAWSNRSGKTCRIAFILIDGEFDANLAHGKHSRGA